MNTILSLLEVSPLDTNETSVEKNCIDLRGTGYRGNGSRANCSIAKYVMTKVFLHIILKGLQQLH